MEIILQRKSKNKFFGKMKGNGGSFQRNLPPFFKIYQSDYAKYLAKSPSKPLPCLASSFAIS